MEILTDFKTPLISNNTLRVNPNLSSMSSSRIIFEGHDNILLVEDGVSLLNSTIKFNGSHGVLYLSKSKHPYLLSADINNYCSAFIGSDNYINGTIHFSTSEQQNVIIGSNGLFSFGIFIRTADPHLIYDCISKERINHSKSVLIGDHVWIGQNALILKGTHIGSGSIVGGAAVVSGKRIPSNSLWAGNPARIIRDNIFFSGECVHAWKAEMTNRFQTMDSDEWIYRHTDKTQDMNQIDLQLKAILSAENRLDFLIKYLVEYQHKDRFYISR